MNFEHLRRFLIVAECLNMSAAAERMYVGQSTLSRQIASMEDDLGHLLFIRGPKSLQLTEAGQVLYEEGQNLMEHLDSVRDKTILAGNLALGTIEVASVPAFFDAFNKIYAMLGSVHADLRIRLSHQRFETICPDVDCGKAHVGLIYDFLMPRYASLEAMPFANETLSVLMHVNHPLAKEKSLRVSDLDNSNVLFGLEGIGLIRNLHRTGCSQAPTAASTFRFENVIMDVKSNSGVAILPKSEIGFHQPDVVGVPLVDEDLGFMVMMVYRKDNVSQKMKRFLDVVKNNGEQESLIGST